MSVHLYADGKCPIDGTDLSVHISYQAPNLLIRFVKGGIDTPATIHRDDFSKMIRTVPELIDWSVMEIE